MSYNEEDEDHLNKDLMDKIDSTALLIDYFATCGIKQKNLIEFIENLKQSKLNIWKSLNDPKILKEHNISIEITSRYPESDKPSLPFPMNITNFCFPIGYKVLEESKEFTKNSCFVLTNDVGDKTYVS